MSANFGPLTATSIGVGEPKLITSFTMSAGSKENRRPRRRSATLFLGQAFRAQLLAQPVTQAARQLLAQPVLQLFDADAAAALQGDAQHRLFRPAGPEIDVVDGVARTDEAHVAERDRHVALARLSFPASSLMISRACLAISSVRSMRVPSGARSRSWNWPESTVGKISVPRRPPTSQITSPATTT